VAINFPNENRSYDSKRRGVRFWGHDEALEVCFLLEEDALTRMSRTTSQTEAGFLAAFDSHRDRICTVARKVYSRRGSGFYILAASDF
jgi:hypothetical protein